MKAPCRRSARVDLIVMVTCFASLALVALPRHLNLGQEARRTEIETLYRSVSSASERANRMWRTAGQPTTLSTAAGEVQMRHGYPESDAVHALLRHVEQRGFDYRRGVWSHPDASGDCRVIYRPPHEAGEAASITVDAEGC